MGGRRMLHFANCQGYISDPCFIGAVTSKISAARNLGSTDGKADLKLPNESDAAEGRDFMRGFDSNRVEQDALISSIRHL
jgi:hypothetical protein